LGILLGNSWATMNQPVQEIGTWVDVVLTNTGYTAVFSKDSSVSGSGWVLFTGIYGLRWDLISDKIFAKYDRSLVGYWGFDEMNGIQAIDSSQTNSTGNLYSPTWVTRVWGKKGQAIDFQANGYFYLANKPDFNFWTGSFSISMWGLYRTFTYPSTWFMMGNANQCYATWHPWWDIGHGYNPNWLKICYSDGINGVSNNDILFDIGYRPIDLKEKWTNLTVVFDTIQQKIIFYINGQKQSNSFNISTVTGSVDNIKNLYIWFLYGWKTDGLIDEVRIYNRTLSDSEIQALYNATK
jgi:hypothetical protein